MKPFFALAPWEYPGAVFDPTPHATTRAQIGGATRAIWLKMHGGIIYFREAARVQIYAISRVFESDLANDATALVAAWHDEIARENYGALVVTRRSWPGTLACGNFCLIIRADGSGWICESFDDSWLPFEGAPGQQITLWKSLAFGDVSASIVKNQRAHFLQRAVAPSHFVAVPEQWRENGEPSAQASAEMRRVLASAAKLWAPEGYFTRSANLNCLSNSEFFAGSVGDGFVFDCHVRVRQIWDLAKWHFGYVGIEWKRASDFPQLQAQYGPRVWKSSFDKWGEGWRGNWVARQFQSALELPATAGASKHDKLEAALLMRQWLRGKVADEKVEAWLQAALE